MVRARALSAKLRHAALAGLLAAAYGGAHAHYEVVDDSGRRLRLDQPARRIVSLAPHLTELLFEAGAGAAVVGAAAYSDYPLAARSIPRIGDAHALDLERIVALEPDLIVAWASGSPNRQLERLERLGQRVFFQEASTLEAIAAGIERLGVLAGTTREASARAEAYRKALARLRAHYGGTAPVRVFYQVNARPLLTVSRRHLIADALELCGAVNVFATHRDWLPRPSREAVLFADPEAIVVAGTTGTERSHLAPWLQWNSLRAVRKDALIVVDPDQMHRATPRIVAGVAQLCRDIASIRSRRGGI
jgi:iron complex transport system substrate-binding protein